jgi:restriction system protein
MSLPKFYEFILPVLKYISNAHENVVTQKELREPISQYFSLTQDEIDKFLPKGRVTVLVNRINWAFIYLFKAGLIDRPSYGLYKIAPEGKKVIESNPEIIDIKFLSKYESFRQFNTNKSSKPSNKKIQSSEVEFNEENNDSITPDEKIEEAMKEKEDAIKLELKEEIIKLSPRAFEQLILAVMTKLIYGSDGSVQQIGQPSDAGTDGVILEDLLGLKKIYIQAKRDYKSTIGYKDVQTFAGAMDGHNVTHGIFITIGSFSKDAKKWKSPKHIKLIGGDELIEIMFKHNAGLRIDKEYIVKKIDKDFFEDLDV